MVTRQIVSDIEKVNAEFQSLNEIFVCPIYDPATHFIELSRSPYYRSILSLRHVIKLLSDDYMGRKQNAKNIDLFMLTPSVSSPMGPGSDSEAIPIDFGGSKSYLTDSSQFGFEPILMNGIDKVYCYLPSLRGEEPDKRHLNQFFHCEIELRGTLNEVMIVGEEFIKYLADGLMNCPALLSTISFNPEKTMNALELLRDNDFCRIEFSEACDLLIKNGFSRYVNITEHGRDISSDGEIMLMSLLKCKTPLWVTYYDRGRVAFYQKPDPADPKRVLNADLLFPPLSPSGFGGEILGAGQRQDDSDEIRESICSQGLDTSPYEWYIGLRDDKSYETTSGFGLGIERFIAWSIGCGDLKNVIPYPRLKGVMTKP